MGGCTKAIVASVVGSIIGFEVALRLGVFGDRARRAKPQASAPSPTTANAPAASASSPTAPLAGRWVWPVPRWHDRPPKITDGFGSKRDAPGIPMHEGVDLMFARTAADAALAPKTPNGTRDAVMPDGLVAVAASDGVVWSAVLTPRGHAVTLDHSPRKLVTFYQHLESLLVQKGDLVHAGQPLGVIGGDPLDRPQHLKHLHFELRVPVTPVDPEPLMRAWPTVPDPAIPAGGLVA